MKAAHKRGDHVTYLGPCVEIGGVKTGTSGVVEGLTTSGEMARVHWDTVEVHAVSWKSLQYLGRAGTH
jgi:hypothetical protein